MGQRGDGMDKLYESKEGIRDAALKELMIELEKGRSFGEETGWLTQGEVKERFFRE